MFLSDRVQDSHLGCLGAVAPDFIRDSLVDLTGPHSAGLVLGVPAIGLLRPGSVLICVFSVSWQWCPVARLALLPA